jgi:hypothetical protein
MNRTRNTVDFGLSPGGVWEATTQELELFTIVQSLRKVLRLKSQYASLYLYISLLIDMMNMKKSWEAEMEEVAQVVTN